MRPVWVAAALRGTGHLGGVERNRGRRTRSFHEVSETGFKGVYFADESFKIRAHLLDPYRYRFAIVRRQLCVFQVA